MKIPSLVRIKHKLRAVSPVVATLILIVVAIVGCVAVAAIVGAIGTSVSSQAGTGGASQNAQQQLLIGGSTTIYPLTEAAKGPFESQYHVQIIDSQGGSGAGMQGVISGALDIGAASSSSAVAQAYTYIQTNNIQGVTLNPVLIGGSGIVVVVNSQSGEYMNDTSGNICYGIDKAALAVIFQNAGSPPASPLSNQGQFSLTATACATGTLDASGITTGNTWTAVSRSDLPSGTEDTFSAYIGTGSSAPAAGYWGKQESGNPGVLSYVQSNKYTIGFVDIGFAEGAASGVTCSTASGNACGVSIPQVFTNEPPLPTAPATSGLGYLGTPITTQGAISTANAAYFPLTAYIGTSTSAIHSAIKSALALLISVNPLTNSGATASYPDTAASGTGLARTFYYVTNGAPTLVEQEWLSYITNPNQIQYFHNNGYFAVYDFTGA